MPTPVETTSLIQDKVFASIQVSQKAFLDSVKSWSDTVEAVSSSLPKFPDFDSQPSDLFEKTLDFNKKLLASQKEFATKVFEAVQPVAGAPASATKSTR